MPEGPCISKDIYHLQTLLLKTAIHQEISDKLICARSIECKVQSMAGAGVADGFKALAFVNTVAAADSSMSSHAEVQLMKSYCPVITIAAPVKSVAFVGRRPRQTNLLMAIGCLFASAYSATAAS